MTKIFYLLMIGIAVSFPARAVVKLPALVGNHMVLQRDRPVNIWGWADPNEKITIALIGKQFATVANKQGNWRLQLPKVAAGGPYQMVIKGTNTILLDDILFGDVWLCSGQSNMEFPLSIARNAKQEIAAANYPQLRLFTVSKTLSLTPTTDTQGAWAACNPNTVAGFSAVGYFFSREIQHDLHIPIGLINSSWGGTVIESWISAEGLRGEPTFSESAAQLPSFDTLGYNKEHRKLYATWLNNFQQHDAGTADRKAVWAATNLQTPDWKTIDLPVTWEFTGLDDLWEMDGTVWFRKEITLTAADLHGDANLNLGVIQNADITYVNGTEVGQIPESWGKFRSYHVPASLLKVGTNVIVVKVENYGGDGGFSDDASSFVFKTSGRSLAIAGQWKYKIGYRITKYDRPNKEFGPNNAPSLLYNTMINPLIHYNIKGVLWYQGESNWYRGFQYRDLFPRMIADWRIKFNQPDMPFLYVQLANHHRKSIIPGDSYWAEVREAQGLTLSVKNTGMVTAIDVGDSANIHPKNKQAIGHRLALLAEHKVYSLPVNGFSPTFKSFEIKPGYLLVHFKNAYKGLKLPSKLTDFQIAGSDHHYYFAEAELTNGSTIKVFAGQVKEPVAVRYDWDDNPGDSAVYNSENLPLLPFRTDNWNRFSQSNTHD